MKLSRSPESFQKHSIAKESKDQIFYSLCGQIIVVLPANACLPPNGKNMEFSKNKGQNEIVDAIW